MQPPRWLRDALSWLLMLTAGSWIHRSKAHHECIPKDIKIALSFCSPLLAHVSTLILETTTENYTHICSAFEKYAICVDSNTHHCSKLFSSKIYLQYINIRNPYIKEPFNCQLPNVTYPPMPTHAPQVVELETLDKERTKEDSDSDITHGRSCVSGLHELPGVILAAVYTAMFGQHLARWPT